MIELLKERFTRDRQAVYDRCERILHRLLEHKEVFERYPDLRRVILFGSFALRRAREDSDVDVYVEGLGAREYWELWAGLEDLLGSSVDLHDEKDGLDIEWIEREGILIYERGICNSKS
ncbi:MAG: nucleotidyltransferase domain-containing protein [Nitrospinae bacterium]|nr:nucleotidyltransferase domain-containing protein [Nitrospinota bacterium]